MVLGGDGTLVRAARDLAQLDIPMIGVNLGTLGYLCELERNTVFSAIDKLFEDEYDVEPRMLLEGCEVHGNQLDRVTYALNDIVIHRTGMSQLISLVVAVNGEYLATYGADGIILSTPTGSTGYNMSAGGPIVDPKADLILITPINSHDITSKSIVVGADANITVELSTRRPEKDETADVSFDGDRIVHMKVGDKILVRKAAKSTEILKLNRVSFLQILRRKMSSMKSKRHVKILELIRKYEIETQEELCEKLNREGYSVTQATVSRDIRELKLTKISTDHGKQKYTSLTEKSGDMEDKFIRIFKDGFVSMDMAQNILVIKTVSGMAMALAAALDAMNFHEIVGSIAGDDTIMCAVRTTQDTERLMKQLRKLMNSI